MDLFQKHVDFGFIEVCTYITKIIIFTRKKNSISLFFFSYFQRTGKKPIESQPKSAKPSTVGKDGDSVATGMIVNLALKSFKKKVEQEGQK